MCNLRLIAQVDDVRKSCWFLPLLTALACAGATPVSAESCVAPSKAISPEQAASFQASPADAMAAAGAQVGAASSSVRNAIVSDSSLLSALAPVMKAASGDQAVAMGTGLGAAAQVCVKQHPAVAQAIQQSVATAANDALSRAFAGIVGDVPVLSVSPGNEAVAAESGGSNPGSGTRRGTSEVTYQFQKSESDNPAASVMSGSRARSPTNTTTFVAVSTPSTAAAKTSAGSTAGSGSPEDAIVSVSGAR